MIQGAADPPVTGGSPVVAVVDDGPSSMMRRPGADSNPERFGAPDAPKRSGPAAPPPRPRPAAPPRRPAAPPRRTASALLVGRTSTHARRAAPIRLP
ncbi:hypothetical protein [Streptomyces sp. NPDC088270]|uniref:hypothetical protein n=1 Tax=Streptomyces sp. NPDC088270 TaxID=3160990 RepID=UPI00341AFFEE